jgi:hypothetical protein
MNTDLDSDIIPIRKKQASISTRSVTGIGILAQGLGLLGRNKNESSRYLLDSKIKHRKKRSSEFSQGIDPKRIRAF